MLRSVIVVCALAGALIVPGAAAAATPVQPPSPADGATVGQWDTLRYRWTLAPGDVSVTRVLFARAEDFSGARQRAELGSSAVVRLGRTVGLAPGTWYWRLCARRETDPAGTCAFEATSHRLVVASRPLPTLSRSEAERTARYAFERRFGTGALRSRSCTRNGTAYRCSVTVRVSGRTYTGRLNAKLVPSGNLLAARWDWRVTRGRAYFTGFGTQPLGRLP